MEITNELINQLNKTIEVSIEHGGDDGGAYYCCKEEIFKEVSDLVKLIDEENKLEVVWNNEYKEQPLIKLAENISKNRNELKMNPKDEMYANWCIDFMNRIEEIAHKKYPNQEIWVDTGSRWNVIMAMLQQFEDDLKVRK